MSEPDLPKRIEAALYRLEDLLMELSVDLELNEAQYEELVRVRDLLATGECKPDQPEGSQ